MSRVATLSALRILWPRRNVRNELRDTTRALIRADIARLRAAGSDE